MREIWRGVIERFRADSALGDWFSGHYPETPPNFFLGYKLDRPAGDFPYLAVVPSAASYTRWPRPGTAQISVIAGLNEPEEQDGESLGLIRLDELLPLVVEALTLQPVASGVNALWLGEVRITTDLGIAHPYYEGEALLNFQIR